MSGESEAEPKKTWEQADGKAQPFRTSAGIARKPKHSLMYGIAAYFAIREAVKAFNQENSPKFDAPFTAEKVLMNLYNEDFKQMKANI